MTNSLDPDQAQHFVGSDLGPNCLQTVCKGYQQTAIVGKELTLFLLFATYAVSSADILCHNMDLEQTESLGAI